VIPDDTDDVLAMAAHWYGCLLTARPNLLDHNTTEATRHRLMKVLLADARTLTAMSESKPPQPPVVLEGQDEAA
jgi:hypothetical protein